jgi:hypothetical protein
MIKSIMTHLKRIIKIASGRYVLIYQMGKVGSSTIESALNKNKVKNMHIHYLSNSKNYNFIKPSIKQKAKDKIISSTYKLIIKTTNPEIKIISMMRDPVSRNISTLFQELSTMLYLSGKKDNRSNEDKIEMLNRFMQEYVNTEIPKTWFKDELKLYFGIDILKYPFDKENGYTLIKHKNINLLLLTSEKMNNNIELIENFVGIKGITLNNKNEASEKWYSDLYSDYKEVFSAEEKEINEIYNSETVRYFYSESDIEKMMFRWKTNNKKLVKSD